MMRTPFAARYIRRYCKVCRAHRYASQDELGLHCTICNEPL